MAKDIVQEAVEQAEAMKEAAYENAKSVLVDAMSTNLKAAVSEAIGEKVNEAGTPKGASVNVNYDPEGLKDLVGDANLMKWLDLDQTQCLKEKPMPTYRAGVIGLGRMGQYI